MNNETNKKQKYTSTIASILAASQVLLLSSCSNCKIKKDHAHIYDSNCTYRRYIISERNKYDDNWYKTDEYILIDDDIEKLLQFEKENNLFRIDLNQDKIEEVISTHFDHLEYQYKYIEPDIIVGPIILPKDAYSWTPYDNLYEDLTGKTRMAHFMYYGYKVYKDNNGNYKMVKSELVDNIYDLPQGYDYITPCFYTLVDPETKKELDYESKDLKEVIEYGDYSYNSNYKSNSKPLSRTLKRK